MVYILNIFQDLVDVKPSVNNADTAPPAMVTSRRKGDVIIALLAIVLVAVVVGVVVWQVNEIAKRDKVPIIFLMYLHYKSIVHTDIEPEQKICVCSLVCSFVPSLDF